jgi:glutaredoxin-like protein NrdH
MKVELFSKSGCMGCFASELMLEEKGIGFEILMMDEDQEALDFVKSLGFKQAPVIVVYNENNVVSSWSGFQPDKIEGLEKLLKNI